MIIETKYQFPCSNGFLKYVTTKILTNKQEMSWHIKNLWESIHSTSFHWIFLFKNKTKDYRTQLSISLFNSQLQTEAVFRNLSVKTFETVSRQVVNGILLPNLFLTTVRKNCSCDQKLLKFEAEGRKFAKILR